EGGGATPPAPAGRHEAGADHPAAEAASVATSPGTLDGPPASAPQLRQSQVLQSLLLDDEPPVPRTRLLAVGLSLLLAVTLAGQWLYLQRVPLSANPQLRPVLEQLCLRLDCELPLPRAPARIEVIERSVREHPRVAQALLVDLTLVSRAEQPIAYPILELRLTDVTGSRVAARRLTPAEYLPAQVNARAGLTPNRPLQVNLELLAPRIEAVSFQFDFR
ncbi:MAG: DUF3426 domain-containing protein, partial [Gammaproteobacteria bacterium]